MTPSSALQVTLNPSLNPPARGRGRIPPPPALRGRARLHLMNGQGRTPRLKLHSPLNLRGRVHRHQVLRGAPISMRRFQSDCKRMSFRLHLGRLPPQHLVSTWLRSLKTFHFRLRHRWSLKRAMATTRGAGTAARRYTRSRRTTGGSWCWIVVLYVAASVRILASYLLLMVETLAPSLRLNAAREQVMLSTQWTTRHLVSHREAIAFGRASIAGTTRTEASVTEGERKTSSRTPPVARRRSPSTTDRLQPGHRELIPIQRGVMPRQRALRGQTAHRRPPRLSRSRAHRWGSSDMGRGSPGQGQLPNSGHIEGAMVHEGRSGERTEWPPTTRAHGSPCGSIATLRRSEIVKLPRSMLEGVTCLQALTMMAMIPHTSYTGTMCLRMPLSILRALVWDGTRARS